MGQGGQSTRILAYTEREDVHAVADMNVVSSFVFRQVFEEGFDVISSPREHSLAFATYDRPGATYNLLYSRLGKPYVGPPTAFSFNVPTRKASGVMSTDKGGRVEKAVVRNAVL